MTVLALRAERAFDGVTALGRTMVLVEDGRITDVDVTGADPPAGSEVVDLGDATLLPGLLDTHVHLVLDAGPAPVAHLAAVDDGQLLADARDAARRALLAGVTTVRDLGDRGHVTLRVRDEVRADPLVGADVVAAGPPVTDLRGHCWFLGGESPGVDGVRATVRRHLERGVDVVKVMATGGELTPGTWSHVASYSTEALRAAVDEAHRAGVPVTVHAHGRDGIVRALDAGVDGIEHASFLTADGLEPDLEVVARLVRAGTAVGWTLGALPGGQPPPRIAAVVERFIALCLVMAEAGLQPLVASDGGIAPAKPHDVLPHVAAFVGQRVLGPQETLVAVTSRAAAACGVGGRKGRLARGFDADLLAVHGDPLADPGALTRPVAVWHRGSAVPGVGLA